MTGSEGALAALITPRGATLAQRNADPDAPISTEALRSLQHAFQAMAQRVVQRVLAGDVRVLIGDDTSGRVVALVLRDVVNRSLAAVGRPGLPLFFWETAAPPSERELRAAGHDPTAAKRVDQAWCALERMRTTLAAGEPLLRAAHADAGVAIIVTEWISSGRHIHEAVTQLGDLGIRTEVATLGAERGYVSPPEVRLYNGQWFEHTVAGLYRAENLSGLRHEPDAAKRVLVDPASRASVRVARADARTLAARIYRDLPPYCRTIA